MKHALKLAGVGKGKVWATNTLPRNTNLTIDCKKLYGEAMNIPRDILSCRVCNKLIGHGQQKEVLICNPCREIGYYIDDKIGVIGDKRIDNDPVHKRIKAKVGNELGQ